MPYVTNRQPGSSVHHVVDSGPHSAPAGTTKNIATPTNLPVRRKVRLHDQISGRPVREQWSDPVTGAYQFSHLRAGVYYVAAFDHTGQYNGEVVTGITLPTPAP